MAARAILVTGGAGFIGSHVAKSLAAGGFVPVVLDNLSTGNRWAVKWGPLIEADVADADVIRDVVRRHRIEAAIHLAASAYVGESVENPRKYYRNNVVGSLAFLDALIETGVDKIVFSSSCAVYGQSADTVISEEHVQNPVNPYGDSKVFIERCLRWLDSAHGLRSVCLRYFNAAGADPDGELGESHNPETHLIPLAILAALGLQPKLSVFGTDYPTEDGSAVRDYTHVSDLARAHVMALDYLFNDGKSVSVNLGTGAGYSVLDVIRIVEKVSGLVLPREYLPRRVGDPPRLVAGAGAAATLLGWRPFYGRLESIVEHAWRWHTRDLDREAAPSGLDELKTVGS